MYCFVSSAIWNGMMEHERGKMIEIVTEIETGSVIERGDVKGQGRGSVRRDHGAAAETGKGGGGGVEAGKKGEGKGGIVIINKLSSGVT